MPHARVTQVSISGSESGDSDDDEDDEDEEGGEGGAAEGGGEVAGGGRRRGQRQVRVDADDGNGRAQEAPDREGLGGFTQSSHRPRMVTSMRQ